MASAYVYLSFNCPESNNTLEATILTYIFIWLLADEMTEYGTWNATAGMPSLAQNVQL